MNRVGDMFLSIGFFAIFWLFGNIDYATVFSIAPYMNETAITIIGLLLLFAAMGKSAQLGLNTWLPHSMEGWRFFNKENLIFIMVIMFITILYLIESSVQLDSMIYQLAIPPILAQIPRSTLEAITGNLLGAGSLQYGNRTSDGKGSGNARYAMTMSAYALF